MLVLIDGAQADLPSDLVGVLIVDLRPLLQDWPRTEAEAVRQIVQAAEREFGGVVGPRVEPTTTVPDPTGQPPTPAPPPPDTPSWADLVFDPDGRVRTGDVEHLVETIRAQGSRNVLLFAHGWNHDAITLRSLYEGFFGAIDRVRLETSAPQGSRFTYAGVVWPSKLWGEDPSEAPPRAQGTTGEERQLTEELKSVFSEPEDQRKLDELGVILDASPEDPKDLERSRTLLADLAGEPKGASTETARASLLQGDAPEVFDRFAGAEETPETESSRGGFITPWRRLWDGAKQALRTVSYNQMNGRARTIGSQGLAPLLARLSEAAPEVRVHLVAHSMGAELVASAIERLSLRPTGTPLGSVILLQGAVPAAFLSQPVARNGDRIRMLVQGPVVATYSANDKAMGTFYPITARLSGSRSEVARGENPFEALGFVGFQGVQPHAVLSAQSVGDPYRMEPGWFYSVDCTRVVSSHADIRQPDIAWLVIEAGSGDRSTSRSA